ncbi:hypothetical protein SAMN05216330_1106 [Bradyrhizobium sp. Ghvi]|nr:hypothetical protein SAMN05216330_1106 [Bradyrhizobium sp. Ghvi]
MPAASARQPPQSTETVVGWDKWPLFSEDAPVIVGLKEALIEGGMNVTTAKQYASSLLALRKEKTEHCCSVGHQFAQLSPVAFCLGPERTRTLDLLGPGYALAPLSRIGVSPRPAQVSRSGRPGPEHARRSRLRA